MFLFKQWMQTGKHGAKFHLMQERRTLQHIAVRLVGNCEDMRRYFMTLLALVQFNHFLRVDRQAFVRIDNDAEQPGVSLHNHTTNTSNTYINSSPQKIH